MAGALIEVQDLHFRYEDGTPALEGVNFELFPGETVAVFGANGSGKTTFILHLNGLLTGRGSIRVCGLPMQPDTLPKIRQKVGMVFQDSDNQLFMPTVLEDVAFGPLNLGLSPAAAVERARLALHQVGILHVQERAPYHLSAGEKKRAAIAGVLAMQPEVLILDEPTTFLDPPGQRSLRALLNGLPQSKVLVTHDVHFARALARRAVFFDRGRITAEGTVDQLARSLNWEG